MPAVKRFRIALCAFAASAVWSPASAEPCVNQTLDGSGYVICRFGPDVDIRLFLYDSDGAPFGHFNRVKKVLAAKGERLVFAMNAGMYHEDRSPVGLYIEKGETLAKANANDGPGNFHLQPNGVFYVEQAGAGVIETMAFLKSDLKSAYATQSGPMLVVDGEIHPRFLPQSDSLKRRNGVGVTEGGEAVFVLSDAPVRFYDFALFFRDALNTPNALYLDGTISRIYAPELGRNDPGLAMGPIIGVVETVK